MMGGTAVETETLAEWLRRLMDENHLSERALAKAAEISRGSITKILNGSTDYPELPVLAKLSTWSGVPIADLLRRVGIDPGDGKPSQDELNARAFALALAHPELKEVLDRLLARPGRVSVVNAYLAYLEAQDRQTE